MCGSALQCVVVCCSVLQCVAVCCSVLQCVLLHVQDCIQKKTYSVLQCVAVCCSVLQCVAVCCRVLQCVLLYVQDCIHRLYTRCRVAGVAVGGCCSASYCMCKIVYTRKPIYIYKRLDMKRDLYERRDTYTCGRGKKKK